MKKTFFIFASFLALAAAGAFLLMQRWTSTPAEAGSGENVSGFAWSETIGWISFNSTNCDADANGFSDGAPAGCPAAGTPIGNYGVNINAATGSMAGYAWSEHIGWVRFDPPGPFPAAPAYAARLDCTPSCNTGSTFSGWARAVCPLDPAGCGSAGNLGAWDGWVKMSGTATDGSPYTVTRSFCNLGGWAWGSSVMGWVHFGGAGYGVSTTFCQVVPTVDLDADAGGGFSDGPISITASEPITLQWTTADADSCIASGAWSGAKAAGGGSEIVTGPASGTATYTLTCTNVVGSGSNSVEVRVLTAALSAVPDSGPTPLTPTLTATLGGTSSGTYRYFFDCLNDGGPADHDSGDVLANPYTPSPNPCTYVAKITYTVRVDAWHSQGTAFATTTITVTNSPPIAIVSCGASPCERYQNDPFLLFFNDPNGNTLNEGAGETHDPDGNTDLERFEWYVDGILQVSCTGPGPSAICPYSPQTNVTGAHPVQLCVTDIVGARTCDSETLTIIQDTRASFLCSLDGVTVESCAGLYPRLFTNKHPDLSKSILYLHDESTPSAGATLVSWVWTFRNSDGTPTQIKCESPGGLPECDAAALPPFINMNSCPAPPAPCVSMRFITPGLDKLVELTVTDDQGRSGTIAPPIPVDALDPLPSWREIRPQQ